MTAVWQPGFTYPPGAIVTPTTQVAPGLPALVNSDFESGSTGWTLPSGWTVLTDGAHSYMGAGYGQGSTSSQYLQMLNTARATVTPGQQITVTGQCQPYANSGGGNNAFATVIIQWYDASSNPLPPVLGSQAKGGNPPDYYKQCSVTAVAPSNAAFAQVGFAVGNGSAWVDTLAWSSNYNGPPAGLVYKATQAAPGKSGATEPAWPGNTTTPVTDNQVTWQGIVATQLVWTAVPVNQSGATEPTWPTIPGASVHDGSMDWTAHTFAISDPNCPPSKVVAIAASKVYAADNDIIRYSATVNPLDWSASNDAGYLPYGLQTYGSNPASAMGLYRSNLIVFNSEGFQMWQVDEDPANTSLLDALPIASTWNTALSPVANDLLFMSSKGVRSVGVAATGVNLEASDVGMPVDQLVQAALKLAAANPEVNVQSTFIPAEGQYWLSFSNYPTPNLTLSGSMGNGAIGAMKIGAYTVTGGTPPYTVTVNTGTFPPGITLNNDGSYFGTMTVAGVYAWQIKAIDSLGATLTLSDSMTVASITISGVMGNGRSGIVNSGAYTSTGGFAPVSFSVVAGTFPPGLSLASNGTYTGTRSTMGTYNFTVRATDAQGNFADLPDVSTTLAPWAWTWVAQPLLPTPQAYAAPVYADPVSGLMIGSDDTVGGVYLSSDGGHTWTRHATGMTFSDRLSNAGISGSYLLAFSGPSTGPTKTATSTDGGNSWTILTNSGVQVEDAIYSPTCVLIYGYSAGAKYSVDGGQTWSIPTVPVGFNLGDSVITFGGLYIGPWNTWVAPGQGTIYEAVGVGPNNVPANFTIALSGTTRVGTTAYSPTLDVAIIGTDTGVYYRTRTGVWTRSDFAGGSATLGVCWCPPLGLFVALGNGTWSSPDGINWTHELSPPTSTGMLIWSPTANEMFISAGSTSYAPYLSDI